ncbi:hypothetical protein PInf_001454 [Phytophthora infestans]|nr:hypothetical protein PInf_001454 [Phytophthora infestans]
MNTSTITKGSLAFLGIPHAASMNRVDGAQVHVNIVDPGGLSDGEALEPIDLDVVKKRRVSDDEGKLLPGSYVGNPVAFIQPDGIKMDTWAYAIVVGYHMNADAVLHLRYVAGARKLALQQPANVVKVEWILQVEGGSSSAAMNAAELPAKREEVRALCTKSRVGLSAKVLNGLTVQYEPEAIAPVIRPDTLAVISVPRRHIVECALKEEINAARVCSYILGTSLLPREQNGKLLPGSPSMKADDL